MLGLIIQVSTGLIRAGTDIYYPPFGQQVRQFLADEHVSPESLMPYNPAGVNKDAAQQLKAFKKPIGQIHYWVGFILMGLVALHILVVILYDLRGRGSFISAMFHGRKILSKTPVDEEET